MGSKKGKENIHVRKTERQELFTLKKGNRKGQDKYKKIFRKHITSLHLIIQ